MLPRLRIVIPVVLILLSVTGLAQAFPQAPVSGGIMLNSPLACPPEGCAAGQRLNLTLEFDLNNFSPSTDPNVQICLYTDDRLSATTFALNPTGGLTGAIYRTDTQSSLDCGDAPVGYTFQVRADAQLAQGMLGDFLRFALRIGTSAPQSGAILARIFESNGTAWTMSTQTIKIIPVAPLAAVVYVANDASVCNNNVPCFVNSGDDLTDGVGTALKDAADAVTPGSTLAILGSYTIKSNTVVVPQAVTLRGSNNASLTYSGTSCSNPMLDLRAGVTLSELTINSGSCTTPARDLISVNSDQDVTIESNDLTGGKDAIHIGDFAGNVVMRFNQITNNSGYAIDTEIGTSGAGQIMAVANNLSGNRSGAQVECQSRGQVDHNYWGAGGLPSTAASNCTANDARRLGAAIRHKLGSPGVDATQVTVTETKTYAFGNQIGFQHSPKSTDLGLYLVNHGFEGNEAVPFAGSGVQALSPCSNFWDIFLKNGEKPPSDEALNLFFKYNLSSGCIATVESTNYCANTTINPPLWWYDPSGAITNQWLKTGPGTGGQATTCLTDLDELQLEVDATGHPGLIDLNFTPLVVGLEHAPSAVVLSQFTATSGDTQVAIGWQTLSELNNSGFYLQRSNQAGGPYGRLPNSQNPQFFPSQGSGLTGASYAYVDTGLTNGSNYYYRLEAINNDGSSILFGSVLANPALPTPTPTATVTPTPSITPTVTITPTITNTPTITGTITATKTPTPTITPTRTPSRTPTRTNTPSTYSYTPYRSPTPNVYKSPTPNALTRTAQAKTPTRTNTVAPGGYPAQNQTTPQSSGGGSGYPAAGQPTQAPSSGYPAPGQQTVVAAKPTEAGTAAPAAPTSNSTPAEVTATSTPRPAPVSPTRDGGTGFWASLGVGSLLGIAALLAGGWMLFLRRSLP